MCLTFSPNLKNWRKNTRGIEIRDREKQPALQNGIRGTSLVAQWLRICLPMQGT